jgi:hypothetical protein
LPRAFTGLAEATAPRALSRFPHLGACFPIRPAPTNQLRHLAILEILASSRLDLLFDLELFLHDAGLLPLVGPARNQSLFGLLQHLAAHNSSLGLDGLSYTGSLSGHLLC